MSDHSFALVPLSSGYFQSPELFMRGRSVDIGLLAEALIYYDHVLINVENPHHFADLISWLIQRGLTYSKLIELIKDGTLQIYYYAFYTNPFVDVTNGVVSIHGLYNIQDQVMQKPNSFAEKFLSFEKLRECFTTSSQMEEFCAALDGRVIEVKADEFGAEGINNAWRDFYDTDRHALIAQVLVNEIYQAKSLGKAPKVQVKIHPEDRNGIHPVSWNIDLSRLPALESETNIKAGATLPLTGAATANKYVWSAEKLKCDLFLPKPISAVVGDKLFEASQTVSKTKIKTMNLIEQLEINVEFPDIHRFVNQGKIDFDKVITIRKKAQKFRQWLQSEADRDRNAIIAYHHEVAQETGFTKVKRRALRLFGVVGGAAAGAVIGQNAALGAAVGAVAGEVIRDAASEAVKYLFDIGADLGAEWKPVVFGNWYKDKISKLITEDTQGS